MENVVWTDIDFATGRCSIAQIGHPLAVSHEEAKRLAEPAPDPQPPTPFHVDDVPAKRLRRDVMKVYHQLGGHKYLHQMAQSDPAQFNKLLMKVLPQTIEADVRAEVASKDLDTMPTSVLKQMLLDALSHGAINLQPDGAGGFSDPSDPPPNSPDHDAS